MNLGLVFEQGDVVLIAVFLILVLMSIITWVVIGVRAIKLWQAKQNNKKMLAAVWTSHNLQDIQRHAEAHPSPVSDVAMEGLKAYHHHRHNAAGHLAAAMPLNEYLTRQIRNSMAQSLRRFDGGLTALASIGATAPFIGLFGTVWGIYHALINISTSGQMSIAAVAGPIGEALVATAAGLFVAIPAVLAYNALVRGNKTLAQDMDGFAHDLHAQLLNSKE